jgi:hypothetical protein
LRVDEVLDLLLDQEGVEIDELNRMEKDTPLHKAVRFASELAPEDWDAGKQVVEILLDAGCDPRCVTGPWNFTHAALVGH